LIGGSHAQGAAVILIVRMSQVFKWQHEHFNGKLVEAEE